MTNDTNTTDPLTELQKKFDETAAALAETRQQLETVERRQKIDQLLVEADAVDLESARLLTEVAVGLMSEKDIAAAVDELKRRKPFLFRRSAPASSGAMSAKHHRVPAQDAARDAAESGNRRDLLRYLRTRRNRKV